jgi:hypothetical protein
MSVYSIEMGPYAAARTIGSFLGIFQRIVLGKFPGWLERLRKDPGCLPEVEKDVWAVIAPMAAGILVALLNSVQGPDLARRVDEARRRHGYPLRKGRKRVASLVLLGGVVVKAATLFFEATGGRGKFGEDRPGAHLELKLFGFGDGCSPAVEEEVARALAICPSIEMAREELARRGLDLNAKTIVRIALGCGETMLHLRKMLVEQFRAGTLPAGVVFEGRDIVIEIDGGRTRLRGDMEEKPEKRGENDASAEEGGEAGAAGSSESKEKPGRSRKKAARTYKADWREVKLAVIFVIDENGKIDRSRRIVIDGTFEGPDFLAEMIAMHLHMLGGAKARSVTVAADGAAWIWDRTEGILKAAGMENVPLTEVLDCCHAAHHISKALSTLGTSEAERGKLYHEMRTQLRNGQWRRVVDDLKTLSELCSNEMAMRTDIAYLEKHGQAGRLAYPKFREKGIPLGSGAIESAIRRVVNQRMKSNGTFWKQDMAEVVLQLRSQILSGNWNSKLAEIRALRLSDSRRDWRWTEKDYSPQPERATETAV